MSRIKHHVTQSMNSEAPCNRVSLDETYLDSLAREYAVKAITLARRAMRPLRKKISIRENGRDIELAVTRFGIGPLVTEYGSFWEIKFSVSDEWSDYTAIVKSDLRCADLTPIFRNPGRVLVRLDSGCETGQVFGDQTCECREQLKRAMRAIGETGEGIIICMPKQDGRGKGISFKLATLWLQNALRLDTVQAASLLAEGKPIDVRSYAGAVAVLKFLGCDRRGTRLALLSNNPDKLAVLTENGIVAESIPHVISPTDHTRRHLEAKARCFGHTNLVNGQGPAPMLSEVNGRESTV